MFYKLMLCAGLLVCHGVAFAQLAPRPEPVALDSQYVPVNLNALANNHSAPLASTRDAAQAQVSLDKIPFDLAQSGEKNNLFLDKAGWPDWEKDPLDFYSAYDAAPKEPTDTLPVVQIPTDDYSAVYILASCENGAAYSNVLSLRIGIKQAAKQTTYHDYQFEVPRAAEKSGTNVARVLAGSGGNVFLLRLSLNAALSQEFGDHRALDVEITKQLRLAVAKPDAARFQYRPLGLPSGVHLYGVTFERAPLHFAMQGAQVGNVFNEPQMPSFQLQLQPVENSRLKTLTVRAKAVDYYGHAVEFPAREFGIKSLSADSVPRPTLVLPVPRRGYYALTVTVEGDGEVLLEKQTTFALLPENTRVHRATSPFGTWDFGGVHYTPNDADVVGPLYVKAGLRYGMFPFSKAERERYGVLKGDDPAFHFGTDLSKLDAQIAAIKKSGETPQRWMLFHEDAISGDHLTRTPDLFTGKHYQMNADERKKFDAMVQLIRESVPKIRQAFPGIKIYLGNGSPQLMEEFLRHKLSPDLFDALGNEAGAFQRLPESQPLDFIANNASLWMERQLLDHYGYQGIPLEQCYEIMYPSSNPGNVTLRGQANYAIRNVMHSLAWKVSQIRFGIIADAGNSYYFTNWGGAGLMFGRPDLSPKPLYVAVATMTQLLDGAQFSRIIPTGTTTAYAFEFQKPHGGFVTCLWTPNASQQVELQSSQSKLVVTDLMSNTRVLATLNGRAQLMANADPLFVDSARPLKVEAGATMENSLPPREYSLVSSLGDASQWQIIGGDNDELEAYNFMQPRRNAAFTRKSIAAFEGQKNVLEIKPVQRDEAQWWIPCYTQLKSKTPLEVKGRPTHISLLVNGNGGWGRIIFELEDAAGQRWISLGAEQQGKPNPWLADWMSKEELAKVKSAGVSDWNSNDIWGRSVINFTGWRYLQFPLPGNYPGEGYHWPYTSQWRCVKSDGAPGDYVVHYPLKVTKLAVTSRAKVLYGTEVVPVKRAEIYLKDLSVTYGDPDTAFWQPDAGQK